MAKTVVSPNARFLLETYCEIKVGNRLFYRIRNSDKYRMLYFDQDSRLDNDREQTFKTVEECMMELLEYLPEDVPANDTAKPSEQSK